MNRQRCQKFLISTLTKKDILFHWTEARSTHRPWEEDNTKDTFVQGHPIGW